MNWALTAQVRLEALEAKRKECAELREKLDKLKTILASHEQVGVCLLQMRNVLYDMASTESHE